MGKSPLLFEFFETRKSKHSHSFVSLIIMRKNKNEQDLAPKNMLDLTIVVEELKLWHKKTVSNKRRFYFFWD